MLRFLQLSLLLLALNLGLTTAKPVEKRDFGPVTIFTPPSNYVNEKTLYARQLMLPDSAGTLLATWENYDWATSNKPYFPIYRSTDHGFTWKEISRVQDTVNGWGMRYQPHLFYLDKATGGFPAGTILVAGNSIPTDLSKTQLDLYASRDGGVTWSFVSHIANGGVAKPNNGETPVWEPFLMAYNGQIVCYYSDQRDPAKGQKLVHQVTSDLKNWGPVVEDEAAPNYDQRPGMTIISKLSDGRYFMTYEYGGAPEANFAVYYKISKDPLNFRNVKGQALKTSDGKFPTGSPYNVFTTVGGKNGTIVVSASSDSDLFINKNFGQGAWTRLTNQERDGYSRSLSVGFNPKDILIVNAGQLGRGSTNKVTASARDVNGCSTC